MKSLAEAVYQQWEGKQEMNSDPWSQFKHFYTDLQSVVCRIPARFQMNS